MEVLTIFAGIILAQITPGPNLIAIAAISLGAGRAAGIAAAFGIAVGVLGWSICFAFGMGAFVAAFPEALVALRLIGGVYFLYLGLMALRRSFNGGQTLPVAGITPVSCWAAFCRGLIVVIANPKAALMWLSVSMLVASIGFTPNAFVAIGMGAASTAAIIYSGYAILFSTRVAVGGYHRFYRCIEAASGFAFGAIGGKLAFEAVHVSRA
jgi:threonine efflux protein